MSVVYLSHIHKTGGTSLCAAATMNLAQRVPPTYLGKWGNCNFNCSAYGALYGRAASRARADSNSSSSSDGGGGALALLFFSFDFIANEAPLVPLHAPIGLRIVHVVVLREPCARTISHYKQELPIFRTPFQCQTPRCDTVRNLTHADDLIDAPLTQWFARRKFNAFGINCRHHKEWYGRGFSTLDDYQARFVCGPACAGVPFGKMRREYSLGGALARLRELNVHATTLDVMSSPAGWASMRATLGGRWRSLPTMPHVGASVQSLSLPACPEEVQRHLPTWPCDLALDAALFRAVNASAGASLE